MLLFKKVILAAGMAGFLFLFACSKNEDRLKCWSDSAGQLKILSTTTQIGDLAAEIGGKRAVGLVLIGKGLDPHSYELVKGDDEILARADIIFYNGLGLEHGASLQASLQGNSRAVAVAERIAQSAPQSIIYRGVSLDPHLWMDVSLWKKGIAPMVEAFSKADPEGADEYRKRGRELEKRLDTLHEKILALMIAIPEEQRYLVTSHDAFQYFSRSYLAGSAAPEGLAPDGQLSPVDIRRIIAFVKEHRIRVLFPESNVSRDSIAKIASAGKEMDLEIQICSEPLYGDTSGGLSYFEMMEKNGETLARNLK